MISFLKRRSTGYLTWTTKQKHNQAWPDVPYFTVDYDAKRIMWRSGEVQKIFLWYQENCIHRRFGLRLLLAVKRCQQTLDL
jgi:hypothetical protein